MNITILSGFGQEPKTFENVFNNNTISLDYLQFYNFEDLITRDLKAYDNDVVIGWSLGGQVAVRLIDKGILKPKFLILVATPFQYIQNEINKIGIENHNFDSFKNVLRFDALEGLNFLADLSGTGDENKDDVILNMKGKHNENLVNWLDEFKCSCFNINFKNFPKTIYICGDSDAVIDCSQYKYFQERIEYFELKVIKNCGHAPHFSHKNEFLEIINDKYELLEKI